VRFSNRLARLIQQKRPAAGLWINLSDPAIAELAGIAGYDWVMIDTEHNPITEAHVQGLLYACSAFDMTPVVRVRSNSEEQVKWVLDAGAGGVVIPSMRDAADARHAVEITKYHPLGRRGFGPNHASGFGARSLEYLQSANSDVLLIGQVELASAVAEIDAITQIEGLDAIWIGPADLAQSLGHPGRLDHPDVRSAISRVIEEAQQHQKPWGIPTGTQEDFESYVRRGGLVMTLGSDTRVLRGGFENLSNQAKQITNATEAKSVMGRG
jgi:2-keto-3-deoxy-L-rhamnonate aldolase RhmA